MIKQIVDRYNETITNIQAKVSLVQSFIPAQIDSDTMVTRTKRSAPLGFVGRFMSSLFGVATDSDSQKISAHVRQVESGIQLQGEEIMKIEKDLSSFPNISNDHVDNLKIAISDLHRSITLLAHRGSVNYNKSIDLLTHIAIINEQVNSAMSTIMSMDTEILSWVTATQTLLAGYLPINFIEPKALDKVLQHLYLLLSEEYPQYQVAHKNVGYYYQIPDMMVTQSSKYLYLTVKIPISSTVVYLDIYTVLTIPQPLNESNHNTTKIVNTEPYFAISRDGSFYAEFDTARFASCVGQGVLKCARTLSLRSRSLKSCLSAIYFDMPETVAELCDVRYDTSTLFEGAIDLGTNHFLASGSDTTWSLICEDKPPQTIQGCAYCLITLPCGCGLQSSKFIIPPKLSSCSTDGKVTYLHTVNLPALHHLFEDKFQLAPYLGASTFVHQLKLICPL